MAWLPEQCRDSCSSLPGRASFPRMQLSPAAQHCHRGNHWLMRKHTTTRLQLCCFSSQVALFFHGVNAKTNQKSLFGLDMLETKMERLVLSSRETGVKKQSPPYSSKGSCYIKLEEPLCSCPTLVHIAYIWVSIAYYAFEPLTHFTKKSVSQELH